jgi:D-amino-acid dehydrogenase
MRILILGANLAGLLSALQMRRQGHEVCVLVHGPEGAHQPAPPLVFTDPGPWGAPQGALATLGALLKDRGDLRLGPDGLGHLGWLTRCLSQRSGSRARSQALRVLAMARRSKLALDELQGSEHRLGAPQPVAMLSVHGSAREAQQQQQRGPMWHLGNRPTLSPLSAESATLPWMEAAWGREVTVLKSEGLMLADGAAVLATLRQQLVQQGVRFVYDQTIDGVEHTGQHLHGVTLRGTLNQADEVDCDLVVAASVPASQPLLRALGLKPDLAPLNRLSLHVTLADETPAPLYIHDRPSGVRLIRQGRSLWVHGPTWLGEPEGPQTQELAQLSAAITRYFGQHGSPTWNEPLVQTSWVAPDGLPLVSRTPTRNLLLNLGHHSATPCLAFGATALLQTLMDARHSLRKPTPMPTPWSPSAAPLATSTQGSRHD